MHKDSHGTKNVIVQEDNCFLSKYIILFLWGLRTAIFLCSNFSRNVVKRITCLTTPSFPDELVQDVDGDLMFQETGMQVRIVTLGTIRVLTEHSYLFSNYIYDLFQHGYEMEPSGQLPEELSPIISTGI